VDDCVWWAGYVRTFIAGEVEVGCERIEDLAAICEVGFEGEDSGVRVGEVWLMSIDRIAAKKTGMYLSSQD